MKPVNMAVSTPFGRRGGMWGCRKDSSGNGIHTGDDFAVGSGTRLVAAISGTIRHRNYGSAFGSHQFAISPSEGQPFADGEVFYAHTRTRLKDGTEVKAGDFVAESGAEGNVSGPHLHFEFHPRSKGVWNCDIVADPQPVYDHGGGGSAGVKVTQDIYSSKLGFGQKDSDSVRELRHRLNQHTLQGGEDLPTGNGDYTANVDEEVRLWQKQVAKDTPDKPKQSYLGAKQRELMFPSPPYTIHDDGLPDIANPDGGGGTDPVIPPPEPEPEKPSLMLPGAMWDPIPGFPGLRPFKPRGGGAKIVLHTTETVVKPNWAQQKSGIPHLTVDLRESEAWQHLPFSVAAYTLAGGNYDSPNSDCGDPTIQVEIVGYAADSPRWSDREYERLTSLLVWLSEAIGVPFEFPLSFAAVASRPSIAEFKTLAGIVGHGHVHGETHTDPGALDVSRLDPTGGDGGGGGDCDCEALSARLDAVEARLDMLEGSPEPPTPPEPPDPPAPEGWALPPAGDFSPGVKHDSFTWMGERFLVWLSKDEIASAAGSYTPGPTYSTYDDENVRLCQAKMGDAPDAKGQAFFGQRQWERLEGAPPAASKGLTTKVATYNCPHRLDPKKLAPDMQALAGKGNTVIGTQENTDSDPKILCPDGWAYYRPTAAMSAAIFWNPAVWTKSGAGFVKISSNGWDSVRGIVWVDLTSKKSGKVWRFGSVHLVAFKTSKPPNATEYRKQVQKAADWLGASPDRILVGDFNGTPGPEWMQPMVDVGIPHTPTRDTGPDGSKGIDHVWVHKARKGGRATDAQAMSGHSDHKALYATLGTL